MFLHRYLINKNFLDISLFDKTLSKSIAEFNYYNNEAIKKKDKDLDKLIKKLDEKLAYSIFIHLYSLKGVDTSILCNNCDYNLFYELFSMLIDNGNLEFTNYVGDKVVSGSGYKISYLHDINNKVGFINVVYEYEGNPQMFTQLYLEKDHHYLEPIYWENYIKNTNINAYDWLSDEKIDFEGKKKLDINFTELISYLLALQLKFKKADTSYITLKNQLDICLTMVSTSKYNITVSENIEKNGIELKFDPSFPDESVRKMLVAEGFKWHSLKKLWFVKKTENKMQFVNNLKNS